jgi:hypothetical protein
VMALSFRTCWMSFGKSESSSSVLYAVGAVIVYKIHISKEK